MLKMYIAGKLAKQTQFFLMNSMTVEAVDNQLIDENGGGPGVRLGKPSKQRR
jgi:hypothetical protein